MKKALIAIMVLFSYAQILFSGVRVIDEKSNKLVIEFTLDDYKIINEGYVTIKAPGLGFSSQEGSPQLPLENIFIGIPVNGSISYRILNSQKETIHLSAPVLPIPTYSQDENISQAEFIIDYEKYQTINNLLLTQKTEKIRGINTVPVTISPFIYNYQMNELTVVKSCLVEFNISGNTDTSGREVISDDFLEEIILNYDSAKNWVSHEKRTINYLDFSRSEFWYKITINKDGMYVLDNNELSQLPGYADPATFRIFSNDGKTISSELNGLPVKEIPLLISEGNSGQITADTKVFFYAHNRDDIDFNTSASSPSFYNLYSGEGIYWLTFGGDFDSEPARISEVNYGSGDETVQRVLATAHFEEDKYLNGAYGSSWVWKKYFGTTESTYTLSFDLNNIDTSQTQRVKFRFSAEIDENKRSNTHHVVIEINNDEVIDKEWNGDIATLEGSGEFVIDGTNNVNITVKRNGEDNLYLDYIEIEYYKKLTKPIGQYEIPTAKDIQASYINYAFTNSISTLNIFEVTSLDDVNLISHNQNNFSGRNSSNTVYYLVGNNEYYSPFSFSEYTPTDLTVINQAFDCIIVTPDIFADQAQEFKEIHESNYDISTKVVSLQSIFDQFNCGMPDPAALNLYFTYVFDNSPLDPDHALQYVLLLGSGTFDWRNFSGTAGEKNRMPIYQKNGKSSDDYYVILNSSFPDLSIGRIPARNEEQMDIVLDKIRSYIENPTLGFWKNTVLILADDMFNSGSPDQIGHTDGMEMTSQAIDGNVYFDKLAAVEYELDEMQNKPEVNRVLIDHINDGRLVWYYIGHGAYDLLGSEDFFRGASDVQKLYNIDKLPLFIAASCAVGFYDSFKFDSLSDKLLLSGNGGSIASLAATRSSSGSSNTALMVDFLSAMLNNRKTLGSALLQAKIENSGSFSSNNVLYNILGDPVMTILPPLPQQCVYADSIRAREKVTVNGTFPSSAFSGQSEIMVLDSDKHYESSITISNEVHTEQYTKYGSPLYKGIITTTNGSYTSTFIATDDISEGEKGRIFNFTLADTPSLEQVSFFDNIKYSDNAIPVSDTEGPVINVFLDSRDFKNGDYVSTNPLLIADIADSNGVNLLGKPGHKILILIDNSTEPIDVTSGFNYKENSYTEGSLEWQLNELEEGRHFINIIAYDNFNNPTVSEIEFNCRVSQKIDILNLLPYPNPMDKKGGYFTFNLTQPADVVIHIYTITGKKIRTIKEPFCTEGYNQVNWDARDNDGDKIANNTYFYKIIAKDTNGKSKEKTDKVVVLE